MKRKLTAIFYLIALIIALVSPALHQARGGQYDIIYLIRTGTGTGNVATFPPGTSGSWQAIATTSTNGVVQTTGSGLTVNPSPVITGTANITSPLVGELGLGGTGQLMHWTGSTWVSP